eukprot:552374-Pyramimonas_sp.AAC.1
MVGSFPNQGTLAVVCNGRGVSRGPQLPIVASLLEAQASLWRSKASLLEAQASVSPNQQAPVSCKHIARRQSLLTSKRQSLLSTLLGASLS